MNIHEEILDELARAMKKFPQWPSDPLHAVGVIGEEFGELSQAVLKAMYEPKFDPIERHEQMEAIKEEAIQTAAMSIRFLMSLKSYEYHHATQHDQEPINER